MTKAEVVALVDRIWATWNLDQPLAARKTAYEAWFRLVHDLDAEACEAALDEIVIADRPWPPRPGALRRLVIDRGSPTEVPPSPAEAWSQLRANEVAAMSGGEVHPVHPLVRATILQLGITAEYGLSTNGDREMFMKAYETQMNLAAAKRYGLS